MRLRADLGNRGFRRYAGRWPATAEIGDGLPGGPAAAGPRRRARHGRERGARQYIDEIDKLARRRCASAARLEAAAAVRPRSDSRQHEPALEATEFIAKRRGLGPMVEGTGYPDRPSTTRRRRLNVRVMIEQGIRETQSFEDALDRIPDNRLIAPYMEYWKSEGKQFAWQFKRQAYLWPGACSRAATRPRPGSVSYGIPVEAARPPPAGSATAPTPMPRPPGWSRPPRGPST